MTECSYQIERTASSHFDPTEDDCDDADCYQPATALLIYTIFNDDGTRENFNAVYCDAHLALTLLIVAPDHTINPLKGN